MSSRWITVPALIGLLSGCGESPSPQPPKPTAATPAAPPSAPAPIPKEAELPALPPKIYEAKGRRDPFRSLVTTEGAKGSTMGAKGSTVASVKLVGIVQGQQGPLALIETTDGLGYIVKMGDVIGDGKVVEIGRDSVTFTVATRPGQAPSRVVLQLKTE